MVGTDADLHPHARVWALKAIQERLDSGHLPNIGRGYSDRHRAAHAIRSAAQRRMGPRYRDVPIRDFWKSVSYVCAEIMAQENALPEGWQG
jgi:hypothetical protein